MTADSEAVQMQVSDAGRKQRSSTPNQNRNNDMEELIVAALSVGADEAGDKHVMLRNGGV
jgi:hypothetical protein